MSVATYPDLVEKVKRMAAADQVVSFPDGEMVYEKQYATFLDLYKQLKPVYQQAA